jgi:hypothetical protein
MSSVVISGDTSGTITLAASAVAGSTTITLPAATGTAMVSGNMPAFSAYLSADQTGVASGTYTKINFDAENFDTNSNFASGRFTPTVAGYYQVNTNTGFQFNASTSVTFSTRIYKNGSAYLFTASQSSNILNITLVQYNMSDLIYMNGTTDYLEIYGIMVPSSGAGMLFGSGRTNFSGSLVRAA